MQMSGLQRPRAPHQAQPASYGKSGANARECPVYEAMMNTLGCSVTYLRGQNETDEWLRPTQRERRFVHRAAAAEAQEAVVHAALLPWTTLHAASLALQRTKKGGRADT